MLYHLFFQWDRIMFVDWRLRCIEWSSYVRDYFFNWILVVFVFMTHHLSQLRDGFVSFEGKHFFYIELAATCRTEHRWHLFGSLKVLNVLHVLSNKVRVSSEMMLYFLSFYQLFLLRCMIGGILNNGFQWRHQTPRNPMLLSRFYLDV